MDIVTKLGLEKSNPFSYLFIDNVPKWGYTLYVV